MPGPPMPASPLQVCKYIDMPLQHISNLVLLAMQRPTQQHTKARRGEPLGMQQGQLNRRRLEDPCPRQIHLTTSSVPPLFLPISLCGRRFCPSCESASPTSPCAPHLSRVSPERPSRRGHKAQWREKESRVKNRVCSFLPPCPAQDHKELVDFCKEFKFERMGAFSYSEEDGTPAAGLPGQVWHPWLLGEMAIGALTRFLGIL